MRGGRARRVLRARALARALAVAVAAVSLLGLGTAGCESLPAEEGLPPVIRIPPPPPQEPGPGGALLAAAAVPAGDPGAGAGPAPAAAAAAAVAPVVLDAAALAIRLDGMVESLGEQKGMVTHFYRIRHVPGATLIPALSAWKSPKGKLVDYHDLNMVIITDLPEHVAVMEQVLERIDQLTPQVEIEAKVIEIKRSNNFEYGFEFHVDRVKTADDTGGMWRRFDGVFSAQSFLDSLLPGGQPNPSPYAFQGATLGFTSVGHILKELGAVDVVVQALIEEGYAEILSAPRILVHNGEQAELNTITEVPIQVSTLVNNLVTIQTTFKQVGIKLRVKPHLIGTDAILLEINPEVSSVTGFAQVAASPTVSAVPIVSNRNAKTKIDIRDGETLVLGGLYEKRVVNKEKRVPILGSIPLLGHLFTSRQEVEERTEIIFILKTTILNKGERTRARLRIPQAPR